MIFCTVYIPKYKAATVEQARELMHAQYPHGELGDIVERDSGWYSVVRLPNA